MSEDDVALPKSAFVPCSGLAYPNSADVITSRPFTYINTAQDHVSRTGCWCPPNGFPAPSSMALFETGMDDNVANCVTVANDEAVNVNHLINQGGFASCVSTVQAVLDASSTLPAAFAGSMPAPPPVVPLIIQPQILRSENLPPRQAHYHNRHHPSNKATSTFEISPSELKNKSRFSATGASGKSTVVRDCKMSLSSSPPSPCAGSVGGSLCSSISRSHFKPISAQCQLFASRNSVTALPYSPSKKISATSVSPTRPSVSPSSRSSTSSSNGVASRKRRADEENNNHPSYRSSGSTSDVTVGVGHVRLCDRSSTGSVSPVEPVMRPAEWVSCQQPHKRSKNDNDEDDDVIFVSMEPGIASKQKLNPPLSPSLVLKPFTGVSPKQTVKSSRKSKKDSSKKSLPTSMSTNQFSLPSPVYPIQGFHQLAGTVPTSFVTPSIAPPSSVASIALNSTAPSKGYFLRSSVSSRSVNKHLNNKPQQSQVATESNQSVNARYQTRSHQKKKDEKSQLPTPQVYPSSVIAAVPVSLPNAIPQPKPAVYLPTTNSAGAQHPKSAEIAEKSRTLLLNDSRHRSSSSSFSKIYDIKGKIGVGGGGVVYAGTRKVDSVEVAIKRVPREKVKRWGKLDGRVVPIEFELLYRAAKSGNKGVIKMYDWFERRSSYILVMERPQPVIDLFDYLNQHGAMPEQVAKKIFRQIVEAVRHCHANGVIHRDIKDENVLLNLHTSEAKLIDFGCGTFMKCEPYTEFAGTPEFYPPEWFTERRYEGRKVDAWSLGVLLYTMVEAEVPFQKEDDIVRCELRHKKLKDPSTALCRDLIKSMLQKDQSKRLSLEQVLQHPWFKEESFSNKRPSAVSSNPQESIKIASSSSLPPNSSKPSSSLCKKEKQVYQPLVMMQFQENNSSKAYNAPAYLSPSLPQPVVHSNECAVHS